METSLRYRPTRAETWRGYLKAWRSRLWAVHAALAVLVAGLVSSQVLPDSNLVVSAMLSLLLFAALFLLGAAYRQLARTIETQPPGTEPP